VNSIVVVRSSVGAHGDAVGRGTALQARRLWDLIAIGVFGSFH